MSFSFEVAHLWGFQDSSFALALTPGTFSNTHSEINFQTNKETGIKTDNFSVQFPDQVSNHWLKVHVSKTFKNKFSWEMYCGTTGAKLIGLSWSQIAPNILRYPNIVPWPTDKYFPFICAHTAATSNAKQSDAAVQKRWNSIQSICPFSAHFSILRPTCPNASSHTNWQCCH